jgi:hypothetical protein
MQRAVLLHKEKMVQLKADRDMVLGIEDKDSLYEKYRTQRSRSESQQLALQILQSRLEQAENVNELIDSISSDYRRDDARQVLAEFLANPFIKFDKVLDATGKTEEINYVESTKPANFGPA